MRVVSLSCSSFLTLFSAALVLLAVPFSVPAQSYEAVGYFCATCTTDSKARQVALGSVPRPECDWGPRAAGNDDAGRLNDQEGIDSGRAPWPDRDELSGDLPQCGAPLRRVVIVNHATGDLFSYLVGWNQSQWQYVVLQEAPLNTDEIYAHEKLIDFRLQWEAALTNPPSIASQANSLLSDQFFSGSGDCGGGTTVLDVALFSDARGVAEDAVRLVVQNGVEDFEDAQPWVRGGTIGVNAQYIYAEADIERPLREKLSRVILGFPPNEYGDLGDFATFEVELLGVDTLGNPAVIMEFQPENSVALGRPLEDVIAGDVDVEDNPCVRDKLATLAQNDGEGEWRNSGGQRIDQSALRGPSLPPGPRCYVYFYQDDTLLYVFRVDCNRAE